MCRTHDSRTKGRANLSDDCIGPLAQIGAGEPQQSVSGVHDLVLAAIVLDQPVTMIAAVELERELGIGVIEVSAADEPGRIVS